MLPGRSHSRFCSNRLRWHVLLQKYGSLQSVYDHLSDIKPAWKTKLEADRDQAFFCERMATLIPTIEPPVPLSSLHLSKIDTTPILQAFSELEFTLPLRRFETFLKTPYGETHFSFDEALLSLHSHAPKSRHIEEQEPTQLSLL